MAKYSNIKLTQKGLDMAINADKSKKMIYTHIGIGDGKLEDSEDILTLIEMKSRKIYADIADINNDTNNQVTLETVVSNKVVNEGFYAREIGIYAKLGEDGEEVLYGYANAGDEADYMPDKTQPIDELKLRITLIVGNVDNVTAIVNSSIIFITLADCRREIARHNADPLAHDNLARKDDYYTKPEVDAKLNSKANIEHGNHVPATEQADNARFLRNDNTWQTVTPNNIGAYHKTEVDSRLNTKVNKSGDTMTGNLYAPTFEVNGGYIGNYQRDVGDAITNNGGANVNIGSWFGVGFYSICEKKYTGTMDLRSGNWRTVGSMTANTFYADDWFRARGNSGLYFQDHGGGFYMSDNDWIRVNGNKHIYTAGKMKADGGFEGTATKSHYPNGFNASNYNNQGWGNQAGTTKVAWYTSNGGGIDFREEGDKLNVKIDGTFYQEEGTYRVLDERSLSSILGLIDAANTGAVESQLEKNGYIKLRNGLIVQWGSVNINGGSQYGNTNINLIKKYNSAHFVCIPVGNGRGNVFINGLNLDLFTLCWDGFNFTSGISNIMYISIGI